MGVFYCCYYFIHFFNDRWVLVWVGRERSILLTCWLHKWGSCGWLGCVGKKGNVVVMQHVDMWADVCGLWENVSERDEGGLYCVSMSGGNVCLVYSICECR